MTTLLSQIDQICRDAFAACGYEARFGELRVSDRPDLADFQCNGVLAVAKKNRMNPIEAGEAIMEKLQGSDLFDVEFVRPGFLNFRVAEGALIGQVSTVLNDPRGLAPRAVTPVKYLLDYGGPNLAKEMHVGHLRASIIGQAMKTILRFAGHEAIGDIHLGDWGLQMGQLVSYIEDIRPDLLEAGSDTKINMADLQEWYPKASALSKDDPVFKDRARAATQALQSGHESYVALWEKIRDASVESLERDFNWLGVEFDLWYGESRYQAALDGLVDDLLARGIAERDEGAVIVRMAEDTKMPPLFLRNSNGSYGYGATDLATIDDRIKDPLDTILYVVDGRQGLHFKQVFAAAEACRFLDDVTAEHTAFGTVNGTDGKPFKTRAGGVMRLHDLFAEMGTAARARLDEAGVVPGDMREKVAHQIAAAAIKFGELSHDREKDYIFDMQQFLQFEGKTGPYIQYTCVRVRSVMANAAKEGLVPGDVSEIGEGGRDLILCLDDFPAQLARAIEKRKPSHLANHAYTLADRTNRYYQQNRILSEGVSPQAAASHLAMLQAATSQLSVVLDVLGIEIPDAM